MGNSTTCACSLVPTAPLRQKVCTAEDVASAGISLQNMETWNFSVLDLDQQQQSVAAFVLLQVFAAADASSQEALPFFICGVREGYMPNPYHNFCHAVDVLHTMWRLGALMAWERVLPPMVRFALLVAALAHDLGHPGFSNVFLIDVRDEVACRFNDLSPLENMHCSRLFEITQQDRCNVFGHLAPREFQSIRKLIVDAVLHTDVARHDGVSTDLEALYRNNVEAFDDTANAGQSSLTKAAQDLLGLEENRSLLARVLLLAADLSNQTKPWRLASRWGELMQEELFAQGDRERSLGLPVTDLNDRHKVNLAEAQIGALSLTIAPFVVAEVRVFQPWQQLATTLADNAKHWRERLAATRGKDEMAQCDDRIELMCRLLENPRTGFPLGKVAAPLPARRISVEKPPTEPCSEPSCPEAPPPLVREIRRWREVQTVPGQQRELVLLYVVSEDETIPACKPPGQPILFRYTVPGAPEAHGPPPTLTLPERPVPASPAVSVASPGPCLQVPGHLPAVSCLEKSAKFSPAPQSPGSSEKSAKTLVFSDPIAVQASMDAMCADLDSSKFDTLLGAVLEDLPDLIHTARRRNSRCTSAGDAAAMKPKESEPSRRTSLHSIFQLVSNASEKPGQSPEKI